ncbi:MAG: GTP-binding protein [Lentisphaeria bacterium]|jgi:bifunctional enzyme CysN/CysC
MTTAIPPSPNPAAAAAAPLSLVVAGHVDHGKSTIIGRLLAETNALPEGKLEQVRAQCARNARPFEYAFLLDALKDEQAQGITIDSARCFFKTAKRRYILIDAPGHVEFLRNWITGAARAEAALLVIDAQEGIRENSKRHGYMLSMLGVRQISVLVNKMDLVGWSRERFDGIVAEYSAFLNHLGLKPVSFIPVSGRDGDNVANRSSLAPWHDGPTVLEQIDAFPSRPPLTAAPFRLPVQDIYKFTAAGDSRRIVAGTVAAGRIQAGDEVVFLPSGKRTAIATVERFNAPPHPAAEAGEAVGFTLQTQIYVRPGELMVRAGEPAPQTGSRLRVNLFWLGRDPFIMGRDYKLKLGARQSPVRLAQVLNVLDAADFASGAGARQQVERHEVAEVVLETPKPVAFDLARELEPTGRLVIVDRYDIAGAGVVLENASGSGESVLETHVRERELAWQYSDLTPAERAAGHGHKAKFVVLTGGDDARRDALARALERKLFGRGHQAYFLGVRSLLAGLDSDLQSAGGGDSAGRETHLSRLGELARIFTDAGLIFITSLPEADEYDLRTLERLNHPNEILVVHLGAGGPAGYPAAVRLAPTLAVAGQVAAITDLLQSQEILPEYSL